MSPVDQALQNATPEQIKELSKIRKIITDLVPEATETISYGIPTYDYKGKHLIHFAAFKNHISLFPGVDPIKTLGNKLTKFKLSKGTIQFTVENPIPESTLKEIIKLRKNSIDSGGR